MAISTVSAAAPILELTIDDSQLQKSAVFQTDWSDQVVQLLNRRLTEFYINAIKWFQDLIIPNLPRGATGLLRQSYAGTDIDFKGRGVNVQAIFGSDSPYAGFIERGTGAEAGHPNYFPPPRQLELWVRRKLGVPIEDALSVAFVIARKIARKGTKAQPIVKETIDKNINAYFQKFEAALEDMLQEALELEAQVRRG